MQVRTALKILAKEFISGALLGTLIALPIVLGWMPCWVPFIC